MVTIEKVDELWKRVTDGKGVEQYNFVIFSLATMKLAPYYEDLHKNWDEAHAATFCKIIEEKIIPAFGIQ